MKKLLHKLKLIWRIILNKSGVRKTDSTSYFVWYMKNVTTERLMTNCTLEIDKDGLLSIENMLMYNVHFIISHPDIKVSINDSKIVTKDDGGKYFIEINNAPDNINYPPSSNCIILNENYADILNIANNNLDSFFKIHRKIK